jgi:hypothetical protein
MLLSSIKLFTVDFVFQNMSRQFRERKKWITKIHHLLQKQRTRVVYNYKALPEIRWPVFWLLPFCKQTPGVINSPGARVWCFFCGQETFFRVGPDSLGRVVPPLTLSLSTCSPVTSLHQSTGDAAPPLDFQQPSPRRRSYY